MESSDSDSDHHEEQDYEEVRWNWHNRNEQQRNAIIQRNNGENVPTEHNSISPWNKENDGVTTLYRCDASDAKCLYIFDSFYKLLKSDQYDIGGAHTDNERGLWFYLTTTPAPGRNYLMNIFVCQRTPGSISIGISDSNTITTVIYNNEKVRTLNNELHWQNFSSSQPNEVNHIKTFCFSEEDRISFIDMVLVIPISINMSPKTMIVKDIAQKIKAELEFGEELFKDEVPDFVLKSKEGKDFKVHKIVLAAHSPKLRDLVRAEDCKTLILNISNIEVELLLQYLYTGVIKDILNQKLEVLLVIADEFQLNNLKEFVEHAIKLSISSENALAIAVIAEKYNCVDIQEDAFRYILHHPEVLDSDAFTEINNANVVKKLLRYIHNKGLQK